MARFPSIPSVLPYSLFCLFQLFLLSGGKIHTLTLTNDFRRNILLSKFGYNPNGTFDFMLSNFTVPDAVIVPYDDTRKENFGVIGFTLSKGKQIYNEIRSNPHICQLQQQDQGVDALFFVFDFFQKYIIIIHSGSLHGLDLCRNSIECSYPNNSAEQTDASKSNSNNPNEPSLLSNIFSFMGSKSDKKPYVDYLPLELENGQYSTQFGVRFNDQQAGLYHVIFHNCFNYRAHGFSDKVAVDFTIGLIERNEASYLSAGDIQKPIVFLYMSFLFALTSILWLNVLCKSDSKNIFKVHKLMTILVFLKTLSLFFHGVNYYFVSVYGHQREIWAIIFYVTHLLKGALLFGTIVLIGTGYTFFKNFLTDRDRRLFMFVLPLQVVDNIAMIIIEESEFAEQSYYFWFQLFVLLDLTCCMAVIFPVVWSINHLKEGARTDGKAAFNLEKLRLFRHFYTIVVAYIYLTRVAKFFLQISVPFNYLWVAEAVVELTTLFFFCLVGSKFRPISSNPYLRLTQSDLDDLESGIALTQNGLYEGVQRVSRTLSIEDELNDIPGVIGDHRDSDEDELDNTLLPKTGRDMGLLSL